MEIILNAQSLMDCSVGAQKIMLRHMQMMEVWLVMFQREVKTIRAIHMIFWLKDLWKENIY